MLNMDADTFKKQIKILYYSKMPQVAQALFDQGFRDSSIASGLLVPVAVVKRWRELHEQGDLLKVTPGEADWERSGFPFDQVLGKVAWTDFPYDIKRVAKAFFEMGLRCRVISIYLDVPISTVYFWYELFKKKQFEADLPRVIEPYQASEEKFTSTDKRNRYSYEMRQVAKECFLKEMTIDETANYLGIPRMTLYKWKRLFDEGRFYVNEKEKKLFLYANQKTVTDDAFLNQMAAKELFDVGATDEEIATTLNLSLKTVCTWRSLDEKNELTIKSKFEAQASDNPLKTSTGYYTEEVRRAAKECFDRGYGYKLTASYLGIPASAVKEWCRLYKKGLFSVKLR